MLCSFLRGTHMKHTTTWRALAVLSRKPSKLTLFGDYSWHFLSKWDGFWDPPFDVALQVSATPRLRCQFATSSLRHKILHPEVSVRVTSPCQPESLILCRSCSHPPWLRPWCQRRPGFRHKALPWIRSHWNIEWHVNFRSGAGKTEHSDNPMMGGGELVSRPILAWQTYLDFHLLPTISRMLKSKDLVWGLGARCFMLFLIWPWPFCLPTKITWMECRHVASSTREVFEAHSGVQVAA